MKTVAVNRRARYDYDLLEKVEAGIELTGGEAKSCRMGHVNLAGSYVSFLGGKPVLKNAKISRYAYAGPEQPHADTRDRLLLLKKAESAKLERAVAEKGMALIPLEVHAGRYVKVTIAVARGRKKLDKRQAIKERETGRRLREGREE